MKKTSKPKTKQYGGKGKAVASTTARSFIPKAEIVDTEIDLNSLSPNELNIPGVKENLTFNPQQAQALVWMNRNHGNPTLRSLSEHPNTWKPARHFKDGSLRPYYNPFTNTASVNTVHDYFAELSHAEQYGKDQKGNNKKNPDISVTDAVLSGLGILDQEYYEKLYTTPGTVEYDAHDVIQPKLEKQFEALKMGQGKYKNRIQESLLKPRQHGGKGAQVVAEKGEVFRDQEGRLNKISNQAPSHDDKAGGVPLNGVESVLSDSYTQVQAGNRDSTIEEKIVKLDPSQVNELSAQFGLNFKSKKSLSPSKTFETLKGEKEKLQQKYLKKTAQTPNNAFATGSYELNLKFANELPTDEEIYDGVFVTQERNKQIDPELFSGNAQYGGMMDDVSMQGYRHDSPYRKSKSLMINGGTIDMSQTPQDLALIPVNGGIPDFMGMEVGEAWDDEMYEMGSEQVLEVPMAQFGSSHSPYKYNQRPKPETQTMVINGKEITVTKTNTGNWVDERGNEFTWNQNTRKFTRNNAKDRAGFIGPQGNFNDFIPGTVAVQDDPQSEGGKNDVYPTSNGFVDSKGRKVAPSKLKKKVAKGKAVVTAPDQGLNWNDLKDPDLSSLPGMKKGELLPLEQKNVIDKKAQTKALLQDWGSKDFPADKQKFVTEAKKVLNPNKKLRFDFSSPEEDLVNGMALADSYRMTPALRQRVNLYAPQQQLIDPTPYLQEIASQRAATLQNVNTNSSVGQAYMAQVDSNMQRQTAQVLSDIQRTNNQIDYLNQQNQTQTMNQEQMVNNQLDKRYYDENLATQEASRQQRAAAMANWANSASQRRRMKNNLKIAALSAPDFFDFEDIELIGNRNNNRVNFIP